MANEKSGHGPDRVIIDEATDFDPEKTRGLLLGVVDKFRKLAFEEKRKLPIRQLAEELVTCKYCDMYNGEDCEIHDPPMPMHPAEACDEWELTDSLGAES